MLKCLTAITVFAGVLVGCASDMPHHGEDSRMISSVMPQLMFQDSRAEEAMRFYVSVFRDAEMVNVERYGPDNPGGPDGTLKQGVFSIAGRDIMCIDSPIQHEFGFTPAVSIFVNLTEQAELDRIYAELAEGGKVYMPLNDYGFSRRFGFVEDTYGVSWQLNLPYE